MIAAKPKFSRRFLVWLWIAVAVAVILKPGSLVDRCLPRRLQRPVDQPVPRPFHLMTQERWLGPAEIVLEYNQPVEFDGMIQQEVMRLRQQAVARHADLLEGTYAFSQDVFGQIEDGLPWWGIEGLLCFGPGQKSIEGVSEEAHFVLNPFLLIMLDNSFAFINKDPLCYPVQPGPPLSAVWYPREKELIITYDMSRYLAERLAGTGFDETKEVSLYALNARDFGYQYVYFDDRLTHGVTEVVHESAFDDVYLLRDFIHRGQSCKYPGGCNNGSPEQRQISFKVVYLPAELHAALWQKRPRTKYQPPDVTVRLVFQ